jgi:hypothetical protein
MSKACIFAVAFIMAVLIGYASAADGTREDPIPMGTPVGLSDGWRITVLDVVPNANSIVQKENMFNDPPKAGCQFFLARIEAQYLGSGSSTFGGSYRLRAVGPSSVSYSTFENYVGVIPDPLPGSEVFSGGVITGNIGWEIRSSDANALVMYDEPMSLFGNDDRVFMALFGRGTGAINSQYENQEWAERGTGKMGRY